MNTPSKKKFKQLVAHILPIVLRHRKGNRLVSMLDSQAMAENVGRPLCKICKNEIGSDECRGWTGLKA